MRPTRTHSIFLSLLLGILVVACASVEEPAQRGRLIIISVVGTNDVHGQLSPQSNRGGLATISGYVDALRASRRIKGGSVVLIDAGDMWQGTLESNLNEGNAVVQAYNAMGYTAAAIGNHELDFGPVGEATIPTTDDMDARGALKKRAAEMRFPLLAANLVDATTGAQVAWNNVSPSALVEVGGVKIGVIGVMTELALSMTIAANTIGLRVTPLAGAVHREAIKLRESGASLIVVAAHAGSRCEKFDDATDLSSCDMKGEIMRLAKALPLGLVDHIVAGHVHQGIAHVVNGIAITSSFSNTRAFGRVDFGLDERTGEIISRKIFPPQPACEFVDLRDNTCDWQRGESAVRATYEGFGVSPKPEVAAIATQATIAAQSQKQEKLGVILETPFTLEGNPESALGNLVTDALLDSVDGDIAIHNVSGGLRADLPQGELTFGSVYEMSPFENRVVVLDILGRDLRRIVEKQAYRGSQRMGFAGMRVSIECDAHRMKILMTLANGQTIGDDDVVRVIANDYLALGGDDILMPAMPDGGFQFGQDMPMTRDVVVSWLRNRGGTLNANEYQPTRAPRWQLPESLTSACPQR